MLKFSKRQIKAADRLCGIDLMILWPAELGDPPQIGDDEECGATAAQVAYARRAVADACREHELLPVAVRVARVHRIGSLPSPGYQTHLAVQIVGKRWEAANNRNPGTLAFAQ